MYKYTFQLQKGEEFMTTAHICIMIAIIIYLGAMLFVGYLCSKQNNDTSDFYLGGRKLGPLVTAMSAEASDMSSWLLMGLPGLAYLSGIADAGWTAIGLAIGTYLNWKIVAKRIRLYTHVAGNSITLPSFFSNRFRDDRRILQSIGAIFIVIFFIPYTASGFAACGKLFSSLFGVKYLTAMIISALIIVGYTTLGGFLAASTTDFIQSIIMSIALIIVFGFGVSVAGGPDAVISHAKSLPGYLTMMTTYNPETGTEAAYPLINIVSMLAWGLGYFGMPHILLRFMAIEDEKKLSLSRRVATTWVVISLAVAVMIGVIGLGMTEAGELEMLHGADSETIIVKIADLLSTHGVLPALLGGTILAGILASTMSTADSQLLAASSAVSSDLFGAVLKNKKKQETMLTDRVTLLAIAVIAVHHCPQPDSSVIQHRIFCMGRFRCCIRSGRAHLHCSGSRTNWQGALAGMVSGGVMVFVWKYLVRPNVSFLNFYELLPAFLISSVMIIVVSLATKAPSKEITDEFELVQKKMAE